MPSGNNAVDVSHLTILEATFHVAPLKDGSCQHSLQFSRSCFDVSVAFKVLAHPSLTISPQVKWGSVRLVYNSCASDLLIEG